MLKVIVKMKGSTDCIEQTGKIIALGDRSTGEKHVIDQGSTDRIDNETQGG